MYPVPQQGKFNYIHLSPSMRHQLSCRRGSWNLISPSLLRRQTTAANMEVRSCPMMEGTRADSWRAWHWAFVPRGRSRGQRLEFRLSRGSFRDRRGTGFPRTNPQVASHRYLPLLSEHHRQSNGAGLHTTCGTSRVVKALTTLLLRCSTIGNATNISLPGHALS